MSSNFFSLPRELRDRIYELVLVQQELIDPLACYSQRQNLNVGLLHVNKTIHREASSVFYAHNTFDLSSSSPSPEDVASFLMQIGRNNADHVRHIYVDFPVILGLELGKVTIDDDSIGILANIQSGCANLSTLTASRYSTNAMEFVLETQDNPKVVTEALELVDTHFRTVTSLQKIIVKVYEYRSRDHMRKEMESHGWTTSIAEDVEEDSDGSCDDYAYDSDNGDYDDYDDYDDYNSDF